MFDPEVEHRPSAETRKEYKMIYPVLLTGGTGTRLWPVSRKSYPKQFQSFDGGATLFQETALRLSGENFAAPTVLTGEDFRFIVGEQLQTANIEASKIIVEPVGKNTAPAVLTASLVVEKQNPTGLVLIAPADHKIADADAFKNAIEAGVEAAAQGDIVTFGIRPTRPETGYGYLEVATECVDGEATKLSTFVEKPDLATAEELVASGKHLWNSGLFLFRADVMISAFEKHAPDMLELVQQAMKDGKKDLDFCRLASGPWGELEDISIDYAIMEKSDNLSVVPFNGAWSDLGSWDSVWRELPQDENNNASVGGAYAIDCEGSLLRSEEDSPALVGIGLKDIVAVATKDAVLIAPKDRAQDVKKAIPVLKSNNRKEAEETSRCHRPWGWYETLALGGRFQVKRIVVKPGGVLSLQSHHHRSEHWVVVEGTAKVTIGKSEQLVSENQSVYIPLGEVHRMENPGKLPMVLIEVQTGGYLGEDDIVRYEDVYDRA